MEEEEKAYERFSIEELGLLDPASVGSLDHLTQMASRVIGVPVSLISIIDEVRDRQFFKSQYGLGEPWGTKGETPLSHSFCKHVVADDAPLVVENAPEHPRVKDNLAIPDLGVIAYLGTPVHDPQGAPIGALCAIDDKRRSWTESDIGTLNSLARCVEESVRLRSALRTSEARRAEQTEFAYAISHDVRAPIRTLRLLLGQIELFLSEGNVDEAASFAKTAEKRAERLWTLTTDLLAYSGTTRDVAVKQKVDLNALLREIVSDLTSDIETSKAEVQFSKLPAIIGDPSQCSILFQNLISNAIKFRAPDRAPIITIAGSSTAVEHEISVTDNGIGIDPRYHDRVFKLFSRLHESDTYEGTGLGLALCARIAGNLGGDISVKSAAGEGSTFTIRVPRQGPDGLA